MRRIDALGITLAVFVAGGLGYVLLQTIGLDSIKAGIWSQVALVIVILGWSATYIFRVSNRNMTYDQQRAEYEEAILQQRLEAMTPEELAKLQAEVDAEKALKSTESE
jgi:Protein of unknown function (DUF3007)